MRGPQLNPKQVRRHLRRTGVPILLVDSPQPRLVVGQQRDELVERMEEFWAGRAEPSADLAVGEFRDDGRELLVIVQESC